LSTGLSLRFLRLVSGELEEKALTYPDETRLVNRKEEER
jgi:hypothetical protein